jgi:hypothetical protein
MRPITSKYPAAVAALAAGALLVPAAADAREPVTSANAFAAAQSAANQAATRIEHLSKAAHFDRSRTSVGNYMNYGKFRKGASFALFGTNTVNGEPHTLWCIGTIEVVTAKNGATQVGANLNCPVS